MTRIHVISDLNLGFNEHTDIVDTSVPDVDLIVLNGNIGMLKRSMLYAETLANRYPEIPIVYNLGYIEKYHYSLQKREGEIEENLNIRIQNNASWPKNLHWSENNIILETKNGYKIDILCTFGYPKIHKVEIEWNETFYYKNIGAEYTDNINHEKITKPLETSNVYHGTYPIWATQDWVNSQHEKELKKTQKWEQTSSEYKILVTHMNPYKDERNNGLIVSPYLIHIDNMLWITSGSKIENLKFLGARLVSNPGRGLLPRSHIINI